MFVVQGATYNHNHSNGMSMELYGKGTVMGIDPGNGPAYEHPLHVNYYTQWGHTIRLLPGDLPILLNRSWVLEEQRKLEK